MINYPRLYHNAILLSLIDIKLILIKISLIFINDSNIALWNDLG